MCVLHLIWTQQYKTIDNTHKYFPKIHIIRGPLAVGHHKEATTTSTSESQMPGRAIVQPRVAEVVDALQSVPGRRRAAGTGGPLELLRCGPKCRHERVEEEELQLSKGGTAPDKDDQ